MIKGQYHQFTYKGQFSLLACEDSDELSSECFPFLLQLEFSSLNMVKRCIVLQSGVVKQLLGCMMGNVALAFLELEPYRGLKVRISPPL